jgi:hypothetical protein
MLIIKALIIERVKNYVAFYLALSNRMICLFAPQKCEKVNSKNVGGTSIENQGD